ncbi:MAG: radical SAM family heme chaperone HemW [Vulcanimicrobiaceae bacterium]
MSDAGGVYVHLPFCPYICPYCDFAKWPRRKSSAQRYLAALACEIEDAPPFRGQTLFLGGGTPNTYEPVEIARLTELLRGRFALPPGAEATIEMNPDPPLCEGFASYREAGINRVSFGVQSFAAPELATLGRRHSAGDVAEAMRRARAAGIANVSLDLIFGVPGQSVASWRATLQAALALEPEHLSTYGLTIEEGTRFAAWYAREPSAFVSNDLEAELYGLAIDALTAAGYEHYEISNFARPGFRSDHNANYWANGDYLGLGVGAASYRGGVRSVQVRDLQQYCEAALGRLPIPGESERLEGPKRTGEAVMLSLRTAEGVDTGAFRERYGIDFQSYYAPVLAEMTSAGMLETAGVRVRLTRRGRFVANDVCAAFVTFG